MYYWFTLVLCELSWGRFLSVGNVIRLRKIQLHISNLCPPSHCSVGDLWRADSHPRALCLTFFSWGVTDRAETFITYFYSCVSVVFIVRLWSPVLFVNLWWSVQWDVWQQSSSNVSRCTGTQPGQVDLQKKRVTEKCVLMYQNTGLLIYLLHHFLFLLKHFRFKEGHKTKKEKGKKNNLASVGILFVFSSVFKVCFLPSFNMLSKDCTAVSFSVVKEGAQCSLSLSCVCLWFLQDDAKMPDLPWQSLPQNQSLGHDSLSPRLLFSGKPEANGKVNPMNIG